MAAILVSEERNIAVGIFGGCLYARVLKSPFWTIPHPSCAIFGHTRHTHTLVVAHTHKCAKCPQSFGHFLYFVGQNIISFDLLLIWKVLGGRSVLNEKTLILTLPPVHIYTCIHIVYTLYTCIMPDICIIYTSQPIKEQEKDKKRR